MNTRIRRLREQSVSAQATVSVERAQLATEFYRSGVAQKEPVPIQRARLFHYLMTRKALWITDGELIVGERGPAPKATPTYPEVCLHSIEDLDTLDARAKVAFRVDEATRRIYRDEIIPFWQGKSIRERLFRELPPEWQAAYRAGVFTEFMEQRSPGHTAMGDTIYRKGFNDLKAEIGAAIDALDFLNDPEALDKREQLQAMAICADALIIFAGRHAEALDVLAA
ncbi:MAG: pyruvate formate lyase family protein, partial [Desulfobacterales bacterium]